MLIAKRIPQKELAEMVSIDQYYTLFFTKHLSKFPISLLMKIQLLFQIQSIYYHRKQYNNWR